MAKRRSDNPLAILILGFLSVAFFGGLVTWISDSRPILKLRPDLERHYGQDGFQARFVPPRGFLNSYIVVNVPAEFADAHDRLEVGIYALERYKQLAEGETRVDACHVGVTDDPTIPPVVLSELLKGMVPLAKSQTRALEGMLRRLGLRKPKLTVVGLSLSGAEITATATAKNDEQAAQLAKKALVVLTSRRAPFISLVKITVKSRAGSEVSLVGGRDAPPALKAPKPGVPMPGNADGAAPPPRPDEKHDKS